MKAKRVKTPGSRNVLHRVSRMTSVPVCSSCGKVLHGIARMKTAKLAGAKATQKRVSRAYGGSLCADCSSEIARSEARNI